jgi:hypothetical protein
MPACGFIKASGEACKALPMRGEGWCYVHHPHYEERRKRDGSKGGKRGGRGRPVVDIGHIKEQLSDLYNSVLEGQVEPKVAAVAAQIANVRTRLVETEMKVREQQELEERLGALEEALERKNGGSSWASRIG